MVPVEHQTIQVYFVRACWDAWHDDPRGIAPMRWDDSLHSTKLTSDQLLFRLYTVMQVHGK